MANFSGLNTLLNEIDKTVSDKIDDKISSEIPELKKLVKNAEKSIKENLPMKVEYDGKLHDVKGLRHKALDNLIVMASQKIPVLLVGMAGCFAKGTEVLTANGYKPIEDITEGEVVASFDNEQIVYNKVAQTARIDDQPKPMIQFRYGNETIRATYDHPFFDGERYYPLYQLAWRDMETSQRVQLKLLCEQYGQTFDYKTSRGVSYRDSQTWERQGRAFTNSDERKNCQGTQSGGSDMDTKSRKQARGESQEFKLCGQQNNEPGVGYTPGERKTRLREWENKRVVSQGSRKNAKIRQRRTASNTEMVGHSYCFSGEKGLESKTPIVRAIAEDVPAHSKNDAQKYTTEARHLQDVVVLEAEPYYALSIENVHTYIVSRENLPVHNTGKTHAAAQVAEALGLNHYTMSVGAQTSKSDIIGYMHASGGYVPTLFRKAYEEGGVFLMDEIDAGNANVLIQVNAALSNGFCAFPDKMVEQHKDFIFIASANTFGNGANRMYVGRNQLDAATLDRFAVLVWDIDEKLEDKVVEAYGDTGKNWLKVVRELRKTIENDGIRALVTPRATTKGCSLLNIGLDFETVLNAVIVENLPSDKKSRYRDMAKKKWNETSETKKAHETAEAEEAEIIW
jgi:MoxR-like ATPase|nr:MAG TPA: ATPase-like protein [Caudoviricetes sp.]